MVLGKGREAGRWIGVRMQELIEDPEVRSGSRSVGFLIKHSVGSEGCLFELVSLVSTHLGSFHISSSSSSILELGSSPEPATPEMARPRDGDR